MPRLLFRVEANEIVGYGHFMRCMAAARLIGAQYECCFVMAQPPEWVMEELEKYGMSLIGVSSQAQYHPDASESGIELVYDMASVVSSDDIVLLDGYRFGVNYRRQLKADCSKVVQFFDDIDFDAAVDGYITPLVLSAKERSALERSCVVFDGSDGFLVRPEFYRQQSLTGTHANKTFIYVTQIEALEFYKEQPSLQDGSVLALTNVTYQDECAAMGWETLIKASAEKVIASMLECNSALLPASSVALEFLVVRMMKPCVFLTAGNQVEGFKRMVSAGYWSDANEHECQERAFGLIQKRLPDPAIGLRHWIGDL